MCRGKESMRKEEGAPLLDLAVGSIYYVAVGLLQRVGVESGF